MGDTETGQGQRQEACDVMAVETGQGKPPNLSVPGWVGSWSKNQDRTLGLQGRNLTNPKARAVLSRLAAGRRHKYEGAGPGPKSLRSSFP